MGEETRTRPHLVSVPVVGCGVDSLPPVSLQQLLGVPDTHGASHDLPHVGHQHVHLKHTGLKLLPEASLHELSWFLSGQRCSEANIR